MYSTVTFSLKQTSFCEMLHKKCLKINPLGLDILSIAMTFIHFSRTHFTLPVRQPLFILSRFGRLSQDHRSSAVYQYAMSVCHRFDGREQRFIDSEDKWMIQASPCLPLAHGDFFFLLSSLLLLSLTCIRIYNLSLPSITLYFLFSIARTLPWKLQNSELRGSGGCSVWVMWKQPPHI